MKTKNKKGKLIYIIEILVAIFLVVLILNFGFSLFGLKLNPMMFQNNCDINLGGGKIYNNDPTVCSQQHILIKK